MNRPYPPAPAGFTSELESWLNPPPSPYKGYNREGKLHFVLRVSCCRCGARSELWTWTVTAKYIQRVWADNSWLVNRKRCICRACMTTAEWKQCVRAGSYTKKERDRIFARLKKEAK